MVKINLNDKNCKYKGYYDSDTNAWILWIDEKDVTEIPTDALLSQDNKIDVKVYMTSARWNSPTMNYRIVYEEYDD